MRSLTTTSLHVADFSSIGSSSKVAGIAIDPESNKGYVAVERSIETGVEVDILLLDNDNPSEFPNVSVSWRACIRR